MSEKVYQRNVYGDTLIELGKKDKNVVVLDADLSGSTRTAFFAKEFPERFFNFGVAEQNMMASSAGLASCNKIVFVSTFAMFATARALDQFRNSVCYNNFNVKVVATHSGITVGEDGASHQALEDISILRAIPNIKIIVPCDGSETKEAIIAAYKTPGPFYVRLGRMKVPTVAGKKDFIFSKGYVLQEGEDIALVACGIMVNQAQEAAKILKEKGVSAAVANIHTIKPIDEELLVNLAKKYKKIVVCEEHMAIGGLYSAVAEVLSQKYPVFIGNIGVSNRFGQSGSPDDLLREYKLTPQDIADKAMSLLNG